MSRGMTAALTALTMTALAAGCSPDPIHSDVKQVAHWLMDNPDKGTELETEYSRVVKLGKGSLLVAYFDMNDNKIVDEGDSLVITGFRGTGGSRLYFRGLNPTDNTGSFVLEAVADVVESIVGLERRMDRLGGE